MTMKLKLILSAIMLAVVAPIAMTHNVQGSDELPGFTMIAPSPGAVGLPDDPNPDHHVFVMARSHESGDRIAAAVDTDRNRVYITVFESDSDTIKAQYQIDENNRSVKHDNMQINYEVGDENPAVYFQRTTQASKITVIYRRPNFTEELPVPGNYRIRTPGRQLQVTQFIDDETGEELHPSYIREGWGSSRYTTAPVDIEGYDVITPKNAAAILNTSDWDGTVPYSTRRTIGTTKLTLTVSDESNTFSLHDVTLENNQAVFADTNEPRKDGLSGCVAERMVVPTTGRSTTIRVCMPHLRTDKVVYRYYQQKAAIVFVDEDGTELRRDALKGRGDTKPVYDYAAIVKQFEKDGYEVARSEYPEGGFVFDTDREQDQLVTIQLKRRQDPPQDTTPAVGNSGSTNASGNKPVSPVSKTVALADTGQVLGLLGTGSLFMVALGALIIKKRFF